MAEDALSADDRARLRFVRPSQEMADSFCSMRDAHVAAGEDEWTGNQSIAHHDAVAYIELLRGWSDGIDLPANWTPAAVYWVLLNDIVVAHCDIRHPLNEKLERFGGHIGYHVHPEYRNRGIATYTLREALEAVAAKGETHALLTCAHDNLASIRVIEKCGGIRISDTTRRRFVIPTGFKSTTAQASGVALRPVNDGDYAMLCSWFGNHEFVQWWGGRPKTADEVAAKYMGRLPGIRSYIIEQYGTAAGYLQDWRVDDQTIGIDIVLLPRMQDQGIGTAALRLGAERLLAEGWTDVGIDPLADNARAIRSYQKAGFCIADRDAEPGHIWMSYVRS